MQRFGYAGLRLRCEEFEDAALQRRGLCELVEFSTGGVELAAKPFLCATDYASAIRLVRGILIAVIDMAFSMEGPFVRLRPQATWLILRT